jgi:hypothetical protein
MSSEQQFYSQEEAEAILRLATKQQNPEGIDRQRLLQTAAELGISADALEKAEAVFAKERTAAQQQAEEDALRRDYLRSRIIGWRSHLISYVCVNAGLIATYFALDRGDYFWPMWPLLGWGIGLAIHAMAHLSKLGSEDGFQSWLHRRRALDEARRLQWRAISGVQLPMVPQEDVLARLTQAGITNKLDAIRLYREATGVQLMAAKQIVEDYEYRNPGIFS